MVTTKKTGRINLRVTEGQEELLRNAAANAATTLSEFVLEASIAEAEHQLADQRHFDLTSEQYDVFLELLDNPPSDNEVEALLKHRELFGTVISIKD